MKRKNLFLIVGCIVLIVGSLFIGSMRGGEFSGADDQAEDAITSINENYEPWAKHFWEPPSAEIESLLFASQAAIGAGFIGYYIGRKKNDKKCNGSCESQ